MRRSHKDEERQRWYEDEPIGRQHAHPVRAHLSRCETETGYIVELPQSGACSDISGDGGSYSVDSPTTLPEQVCRYLDGFVAAAGGNRCSQRI